MEHLTRDCDDFLDECREKNNNNFSTFGARKISEKAKTNYCWLDWLSIWLPLNFCEKEKLVYSTSVG